MCALIAGLPKLISKALIEEQKRKGSRINPHYLSLLSRTLTTASRIDVALGNSEKGTAALMKATDLMEQAIALDPARVRDRAFLNAIAYAILKRARSTEMP